MDGLLFDTEKLYQETWHELADEYGVTLRADFLKAISGTNGVHMNQVLEKYYHVPNGSVIASECMKRMGRKLEEHVPVKDGVREILQFFREQGIRMAVASSSSVRQIEANLKKSGLKDYFEAIVGGDEVFRGKPAPDIFRRATEKLGCEPEKCYVFEDSENGIKAGAAAGCITVMVPDLMEPCEQIRPYCFRICENLLQAKDEIIRSMYSEEKNM